MNANATSTIGPRDENAAGSDSDDPGSSANADLPAERTDPPTIPADDGRIEVIPSEDGLVVPVDLAWLAAHLRRAAALINRPLERLTVEVMGDAEIAGLHKLFAGIDEPTDVLTFPMHAPGEGEAIDADIAVGADVAARRAAELGHTIERELLLYALHGVLHCAGFDDHTEAGYAAMHAEEDRILAAIGVGAVFARGPGGDAAP